MPAYAKDYDVEVQKAFALAQGVQYPSSIVADEYDQFSVSRICSSKGINKEWLFHGLGGPIAYCMNFSKVLFHSGFHAKISRMAVNIQNPGNQKDAVPDLMQTAMLEIQSKNKTLMLLDEFTPEFLYEMLKANNGRALGLFPELRSFFNGLGARAGQSTVSPKERIIRLYEHNRWVHGVKGDHSYNFEEAERNTVPKGLFGICGAIQPENRYTMRWQDSISGSVIRWMEMATPRAIMTRREVEKVFSVVQLLQKYNCCWIWFTYFMLEVLASTNVC